MINSFPKLLNAAVVTFKTLSVSLIVGLFIGLLFAILRLSKTFLNKFAYGYSYVLENSVTSTNIHYLFWFRSN